VSAREDVEMAARIVDQVERGIRRDGLTSGVEALPEAFTEARDRLWAACPWSQFHPADDERKAADPRWHMYEREVERALTRLYSPYARPTAVPVTAPLAASAELGRWLDTHGVAVTPAEPRTRVEPEGPETLDMFGDDAA
jgi:hypothetical protein